jgi:hypothetical protein
MKPINPASRYIREKPCASCGGTEFYRKSAKCCACQAESRKRIKASGPRYPRPTIYTTRSPINERRAAVPHRPAHPHVIESDFIRSPTLAQLMSRR